MKIHHNSTTDRIGVQAVGEQFERAGYIFREQPISDYGIDAQIEFVEGKTVTGKLIALQIKTGISWFQESKSQGFIFRGDSEHLEYWIKHSLPVLIILHNPETRISYWQAIKSENVIPTGQGWKIMVPENQRINPGMDVDLKRLVNKLTTHKDYTIFHVKDLSHRLAKRYSLRVILNKEHTQSEIIDLIKSLTIKAIDYKYYRNQITQKYWHNKPAHVVWLFIYPSAEDESNNNFICQTEWFSENIPLGGEPSSIGGEEISNRIKVKWNYSYLTWSQVNDKNTINKEDFVKQVLELTNEICDLLSDAESILGKYDEKEYDFETLLNILSEDYEKATEIYYKGTDIGLSPYECKRVDQEFQTMIAHAHNVYIFLGEYGVNNNRTEENFIWNVRSQLNYFKESNAKFRLAVKEIQ
ncbi:DUF4365 domain-containing protein [Spirulina major]|uniref:DUF4365 domain-containing protein n=1 Tax=Spirulina major TaxID=270636 RepID=UPI0009324873|nr:DUF4365 domain-containing protein [Spirulina major]